MKTFIGLHLDTLRWLLAYYDAECTNSDSSNKDLARRFMGGVPAYEKLTEEEVIDQIKEWWMQEGEEPQQQMFIDRCESHDIDKKTAVQIWVECGGEEI